MAKQSMSYTKFIADSESSENVRYACRPEKHRRFHNGTGAEMQDCSRKKYRCSLHQFDYIFQLKLRYFKPKNQENPDGDLFIGPDRFGADGRN